LVAGETRRTYRFGSAPEANRILPAGFQQNRVAELANFLRLLGPRQTLERGYSITLNAKGGVVQSVRTLKADDPIQTMLADGEVNSIVKELLERESNLH
jgi:exodeoxyribonuclease VII large subunit